MAQIEGLLSVTATGEQRLPHPLLEGVPA